jgi:serine/threonine-protein kinase
VGSVTGGHPIHGTGLTPAFLSPGSTSEMGSFPSPLSMSSQGAASGAPLASVPPGKGGSKGMLLVAVVGALAVAGTSAFVALRPGPVATAGGQPATPVAAGPSSSARTVGGSSPVAAPAQPAAAALVKVRVNTDPDGASVKEDGVELCSSTPCDILYKGPDADPSREHKLTVARQGYKSETKSVRVGESPVTVKLSRAEAPRVVPQAQSQKSDTPATVPTGYKNDVPY